ncbi:D-tagatose-bisphosphate aldolase, class II, non-catalytic subunit [Tabrizicola sp.]|uniref:D-tagatose-bisphosphate aldolase, class II, non-catalytic subunit n=1 Tax=Tabrizicola sp. TaxID=2005166 RepID=UPI0025EE46D1|nr:D-tagatose-bisphosphate aldolase, class II, non-catalytic subunit [Tabrizicola sp.]
MSHPLLTLAADYRAGMKPGITSVCSAHPTVIEATLRHGSKTGLPVVIEATCNQVNQDGGYTGMTPADFRDLVFTMADRVGYPKDRIILGGDHLGPNPWKHLPADQAMAKAEEMIAAFAAAGFTKLHLDTSMGCFGEPVALADAKTAERAARLAAMAEAHHKGSHAPVYVIGTEVPVPGGAVDGLDHLQITEPASVATTYEVHRSAFDAAGQSDAFSRVIALVVQPGVEFGHDDVIHYAPEKARALSAVLSDLPTVVFEAHSTDYQTDAGLRQMVGDGFSILKVGPWLTFALREALYGLDAIADVLDGTAPQNGLMRTMESVMQTSPANWAKYYHGSDTDLWVQRHFSYSDRIRYYWPDVVAHSAVEKLKARLSGRRIPAPVRQQYLPTSVDAGPADIDGLLRQSVEAVLNTYHAATTPG